MHKERMHLQTRSDVHWTCDGRSKYLTIVSAAAAAAAEICGSVAAGQKLYFLDIFLAFLNVLSIFGRFVAFLDVLECFWTFYGFWLSASFS